MSSPFRFLITIEPLGLLYASSGRFLSAENLVGLAGEHFPPDSPAVAGLIAGQLSRAEVRELHTAGPFWCDAEDLYLPAPLNLLQDKLPESPPRQGPSGVRPGRAVMERLVWRASAENPSEGGWTPARGEDPPAKPVRGGWIPLTCWGRQAEASTRVFPDPWRLVPHLHPRLCDDQRVSAQKDALFMEMAAALEPGVRLAYLSSHQIPEGRYRFGGEGHLVEVSTEAIPPELAALLNQPLSGSFALVAPGLWGGSRLSQREPLDQPGDRSLPARQPWHLGGQGPAILTDRPRPWRHRLGAGIDGRSRLSRGRWAMPAGSCYHLPPGLELPPWPDWPESWFPREGFSFKQLGTALALPLP